MEALKEILRASPELVLVWRGITYLCATYLIVLAGVIFFRRDLAMKFFSGFASTAGLNTLEVVLRFLAGIAFMGAAAQSRFPEISFYFGLFLAVTALVLLLFYPLHKRFAVVVMKGLPVFLPLMGPVCLVLAGLIIYAFS